MGKGDNVARDVEESFQLCGGLLGYPRQRKTSGTRVQAHMGECHCHLLLCSTSDIIAHYCYPVPSF